MATVYTLRQVKINNGRDGKPCWIIIRDSVYDLTKFLEEHPGGKEVLLDYGGENATKEFISVGHSSEAIEDMAKYKIGAVSKQPTMSSLCNEKQKLPEESKKPSNESRGFNFFFCC